MGERNQICQEAQAADRQQRSSCTACRVEAPCRHPGRSEHTMAIWTPWDESGKRVMHTAMTAHSDSTQDHAVSRWDGADKVAMDSIQQAHKDVQDLLRTGVGIRKKFSALRLMGPQEDEARFRAECLHLTSQAVLAIDRRIQSAAASTMVALDKLDAQVTSTHSKVCSIETLVQISCRHKESDKEPPAAPAPAIEPAPPQPDHLAEKPALAAWASQIRKRDDESPTASPAGAHNLEQAMMANFESSDSMPSVESIRLGLSLVSFPTAVPSPLSQLPVPPQPLSQPVSPLKELPSTHVSPTSPKYPSKRKLPPPLTPPPPCP